MILYLGNKLSRHGFTPTSVETLGPRLSELGYEVILKSDVRNPLFRLFDMLLAVVKFRRHKPIVLIDTYSTTAFWYAVAAGLFCRILQLRYIPILRGGNLPHRIDSWPKVSKNLFQHAAFNVAVSEYMANAFLKRNLQAGVIHNFIDLNHYPFRQRGQLKPTILWVRAFHSIYNPQLAIRVFKRIATKYENTSFCMVGPDKDGSMKKCIDLAQSLNVEVKFTGKMGKEEWIRMANDYDIFLNTTNVDNTPVSVMEAMSLGMPVVTTNVGGIPFLFKDRSEGFMVPPGDEEGIVEAIDLLLKDADIASGISKKAREKACQWDWKVISKQWKSLLDET
jgi:glycosyltransferase involved in cell wall biosynthesis